MANADASFAPPVESPADGELPSVGDVLAQYGPRLLRTAVQHPELLLAAGLALVAHKRVPGIAQWFQRLVGGR